MDFKENLLNEYRQLYDFVECHTGEMETGEIVHYQQELISMEKLLDLL